MNDLELERCRSSFYKGILEAVGLTPPPFVLEGYTAYLSQPLPKIEIVHRYNRNIPSPKKIEGLVSKDLPPPTISPIEEKGEVTLCEHDSDVLDMTLEPTEFNHKIAWYASNIEKVTSFGEPVAMVLLQTLFTEAEHCFGNGGLNEFEFWFSSNCQPLVSNLKRTSFYDQIRRAADNYDLDTPFTAFVLFRTGVYRVDPIDVSSLSPIINGFVLDNYSPLYALQPIDKFIDETIKPFVTKGKTTIKLGNVKGIKYCMTKLAYILAERIKEVCVPLFRNLYRYIYYHNNYAPKLVHQNLVTLFHNVELACVPPLLAQILRVEILDHLEMDVEFPPHIHYDMAMLSKGIPPTGHPPDTLQLLYQEGVSDEISLEYSRKYSKILKSQYQNVIQLTKLSKELQDKVSTQVNLYTNSFLRE